jgi:ceramide glucosyltransferase
VGLIAWLAVGLAGLFVVDRLWKVGCVVHFMRRPEPPAPAIWPSVTLIQPITVGWTNLRMVLEARVRLRYAGTVQHILVCDAGDAESLAICRAVEAEFPQWPAQVVLVETNYGSVASKIAKMQSGIRWATGEVIAFVDDDITLPPAALEVFVRHLGQPGGGVVFGLACYTDYRTVWSSLMSLFVNANALTSYIPGIYLTEPFTVTGHVFALRRDLLEAAGSYQGRERTIDDDHEIARRARAAGLLNVQTPLIYCVDNELATWRAFRVQMKRWFIIPRQTMLPSLTRWERWVLFAGGVGNLIPGLVALLALLSWQMPALAALLTCLMTFYAVYFALERAYLPERTPPARWPWLLVVALVVPWQVVAYLLADDVVEWRGQRFRLGRDGRYEIL